MTGFLARVPEGFYSEWLGGGLGGYVYDGINGSVVLTDDADAILVGYYPGTNWDTGDEPGNEYEALLYDEVDVQGALDFITGRVSRAGEPSPEHRGEAVL